MIGNENVKVGKLFMKDLKTGETFEFDGIKPIEQDITTTAASEQSVPDGINIHISGSDINRINDIYIYFKEDN